MDNPGEVQTWLLNKVKQIDSRLDALEAKSPEGESSAIACSGAGRPDNEGIRGVPGPGEILAKMEAFRDGECGVIETPEWWGEDYSFGYLDARKELIQHLAEILGVEAQAPAQDEQ